MKKAIINVSLNNLLDGTFRFYLNDKYREQIFLRLKKRYKDWRIAARNLNIPIRNLFGLRRGWEYRYRKKLRYPINAKWLKSIQNLLNLDLQEIERNVNAIKLGTGGHRSKIELPIVVDLNNESVNSLRRALAEFIFIKKYEKNLDMLRLNKNLEKINDYVVLKINIEKEVIDRLANRGLNPNLVEEKENYVVYYRNPNVKRIVKRIIPKQVIFDEIFSKEFGKWYGDKCGGSHQTGLTNIEENFVKSFYEFLITKLNQPKSDINLSLDKRKDVSYYRVVVSNKLLRKKAFNFLENNIFSLLYNSKKSVRHAFYAGLFEAEGSISQKGKDFVIASFGLNMKKERTPTEILKLLEKVIKFDYLLKKDGFNSRISRKVAATEKSSTLKYDVRLILGKNFNKRIRFIKKNIFPYITHKPKLNRFKEMGGK